VPGPVEGYMTPEEVKHTLALYAGEVTFVDKWVGVLLDRIRDLGLYDNSLIMFTTDHGEPFGEHGIIRKARPWCYEELCHIPWLIRHPEGTGAGSRFGSFVQTPDLMPTVLDALGIPPKLTLPYTAPVKHTFPQDIVVRKQDINLTGKSLLPMMRGEEETVHDFAVSAHHGSQWAIRTADWTYLYNLRGARPNELYDRRGDPAEQRNVIEEHREAADALELTLRRFAESLEAAR